MTQCVIVHSSNKEHQLATRLWCLYEIYLASLHPSVTTRVILSGGVDEEDAVLLLLCDNPLEVYARATMQGRVRVAMATATRSSDEKEIRRAVARVSGGRRTVDDAVARVFVRWIAKVITRDAGDIVAAVGDRLKQIQLVEFAAQPMVIDLHDVIARDELFDVLQTVMYTCDLRQALPTDDGNGFPRGGASGACASAVSANVAGRWFTVCQRLGDDFQACQGMEKYAEKCYMWCDICTDFLEWATCAPQLHDVWTKLLKLLKDSKQDDEAKVIEQKLQQLARGNEPETADQHAPLAVPLGRVYHC